MPHTAITDVLGHVLIGPNMSVLFIIFLPFVFWWGGISWGGKDNITI